MYFWRIEKLKARMAAAPLTEREVLPYLLVFVGLVAAVGYLPTETADVWDVLGGVWSVAIAVLGTIYIYRRNGGAGGAHFLQRYFAIGWVVSLRWLVVLLVAGLVFYVGLGVSRIPATAMAPAEFVFLAAAETVVYWRIGCHVRDLAERAAGGAGGKPHSDRHETA